jgi:hypothetical protein
LIFRPASRFICNWRTRSVTRRLRGGCGRGEAQGIIETLPGKGYFLKQNKSPFSGQVRQQLLLTEIDEAVVMAHHLQVDRDKFLALVKERLDYFERKSETARDDK